jgi:hypothetical protein
MVPSAALRLIAFGTIALLPASGHADSAISVTSETVLPPGQSFASVTVQPNRHFGPFAVVAAERVEMNGSIESDTPQQFRALLQAYPGIRQIDMIDVPGTGDDVANLLLARMVRKAGITTFVPSGGSVRSGGVELFLAGATRRAAPDAEFAVHSWIDEDGMEPDDFLPGDPVNREYVDYYREMGMSADNAQAFYTLTNSVPSDGALTLHPHDIAAYIPLD